MLIISAFLVGISVDYFSDTMGMHAAATVCMAYFRPRVLRLIAPRDTYEAGTYPQMNYFGFAWFVQYCLILCFIHHFVLFFAEVFTFSGFFSTMFRIICSTLFTSILIVASQVMTSNKARER